MSEISTLLDTATVILATGILGAVDDPMHCCPRPSAFGLVRQCHLVIHSTSGEIFDCCTERYEIVVYYPTLTFLIYSYNLTLATCTMYLTTYLSVALFSDAIVQV